MPPKLCEGCELPTTRFPALFPNCKGKHESHYCSHCWNKYLAIQVLGQRQVPAQCVHYDKCGTLLTRDEVKKIGNREIIGHYDYLLLRAQAEENNEIECLATYTDATTREKKTCHHFQAQDPGSRTSTCAQCSTTTCIPCGNIPDHPRESCTAYRARMHHEHSDEELATHHALEHGYHALEHSSTNPYTIPHSVPHNPLPCPTPTCGILIERMHGGGCAHMVCPLCKTHFCAYCGARYCGEAGVYDVGNAAHGRGCTYFKRRKQDRRLGRKRRWDFRDEDGEGEGVDEGGGLKRKRVDGEDEDVIEGVGGEDGRREEEKG